MDGKVLWVQVRVFFQREKEGHKIFFVLLSDMTSLRDKRVEQARSELAVPAFTGQEQDRLNQYYGNLPCGYGLFRIILDGQGEPADYEIIYTNQEMERICGSDMSRMRGMISKAFGDDSKEMMRKAYQAAFLGDMLNHYAYSSVTSHYLQLTFYQYEYGYVACLVRDVTHMQL